MTPPKDTILLQKKREILISICYQVENTALDENKIIEMRFGMYLSHDVIITKPLFRVAFWAKASTPPHDFKGHPYIL